MLTNWSTIFIIITIYAAYIKNTPYIYSLEPKLSIDNDFLYRICSGLVFFARHTGVCRYPVPEYHKNT
jgi:hypothetical protein